MNELTRRIGKFNNPEDLLKAYESLEAEFTKRCQRLKDSEKENEAFRHAAGDKSRKTEEAKALLVDDGFLSEHVFTDENITHKVISRYLEDLTASGRPRLLGAGKGAPALSPPKTPKSLEEAKRLAEIILRG